MNPDQYAEFKRIELFNQQKDLATTTNGTGVDIQKYPGWARVILVGEGTDGGGSNTMAVTLQSSDAVGGSYAAETLYDKPGGTASPFTTCTHAVAVDEERYINLGAVANKFVRAVATIAGTTPKFNFSVQMIAWGKRLPVS
jgi:hypothetical protein